MKKSTEKEQKDIFSTQDIVLIALFASLITICSFIKILIGPIPFTLQTFGVFVTAGLLGTKRGTTAVIVYVLLGFAGIPVFEGAGGPAALTGSTGGYIIGFIFIALVIGIVNQAARKKKAKIRAVIYFVGMLLGDMLCFTIGTIHFMVVTGMELSEVLAICVVPFIIPDIIKMIVANLLVNAVKAADYNRKIFD